MKATTIKLEGKLLTQLKSIKPQQLSLSAFVRELIEHAIRRQRLQKAAYQYSSFLASKKEERDWLEEWETADLSHPPKRKKA
ncbi:MAG TPA: hypothetical protein VJL87_00615 [Bdellovibrionota bacterium]|nr:hypothetical protein [Bdellovibrionota bacterium]